MLLLCSLSRTGLAKTRQMAGGKAMQPIRRWLAVTALAALPLATPSLGQPAPAQATKPGIERLYILNCGEGVAGDISRWSPGVNVGKSMDFVDSCYLIKHAQRHSSNARSGALSGGYPGN